MTRWRAPDLTPDDLVALDALDDPAFWLPREPSEWERGPRPAGERGAGRREEQGVMFGGEEVGRDGG